MLSDLMLRQAKATGKPYSLADFDGLYLYVSAIGTKAWHFRYTWNGKRERMTFGAYPALSLKDARDRRDEARAPDSDAPELEPLAPAEPQTPNG